ncbi:rhodanese-like domain-containing protein [Desulfobotulus mexicanus]|uniref:Sulfurtransferase n=1 Tax=Desulfobotulus mexicanus TaxID=2586642 RepID=A0A5Q4VGU8_9BACT|nr:rhodanese-like domain-containing protein [Desulfobotulus mexicanus]TYT75201.1 sulfurtransferase [Desulfobotulus mexicanus]
MPYFISPLELEQQISADTITVLDVRRIEDQQASPSGIKNADWYPPEDVNLWADGLSKEKPVAIYCVRGGSVSSSVYTALTARGLKVRILEGGLAAWETHAKR